MADHSKPPMKRKREEEQELPEYMELFLTRAIDRFQAHFDDLLLPRLNQFDNRLQALENPTPVPPTLSDDDKRGREKADEEKKAEAEKKEAGRKRKESEKKRAQIQDKKKKPLPSTSTSVIPPSTSTPEEIPPAFASIDEYEEAVVKAFEESRQMETPQQREERELQEAIKRSLEE